MAASKKIVLSKRENQLSGTKGSKVRPFKRPLWELLERLNTPFDSLAHTLDVRRIPPRRGRYNIPNIGIFVWRLNSYSLTNAQPFKLNDNLDDRRYFFSPLGNDTPLFTRPETLPEFSGLSTRMNVPDPISRRTLDQYLQDYYGPGKSLLLTTKGPDDLLHPVPQDQITVCDLSDMAGDLWAHQPKKLIAIDPLLGRIAFPSDPDLPAVSPADVRVMFHYGFSADMGGGEYDRSKTIETDFLDTTDKKKVTWQIGVSGTATPIKDELVATLAEAVQAWNGLAAGAVGVIVIMDSGSYDLKGMSDIVIPEGSDLLIIAAGWPQVTDSATGQKQRVRGQFNASSCRPHLRGNIQVRPVDAKAPNSGKLFLNGLLIEGSLSVTDRIQSLSVSHSTLVPGLGLSSEGFPKSPRAPSLAVTSSDPNVSSNVNVAIDFSIVGGIRVDKEVTTSVNNSIVDATSRCGVAFSAADDHSPGGTLQVANSTLIGKVHTALMELVTNSIFLATLTGNRRENALWFAPVRSEQRQAGCVSFSYVPPGSRTPRRYRCQPAGDDDTPRVAPQFSSLHYGEPAYAQLSRRCPPEIFSGASDESEMGAYHDLFEPQRLTNLGVRLNEYLRFGLEAGIFFEPHMESRAMPDLCDNEVQPELRTRKKLKKQPARIAAAKRRRHQ